MYWLQSDPGVPAVAYHAGFGEAPYLSVAFQVDGPVAGLHGDAYVAQAQARFGELMAGWGASQKLVTGIQIITRVLPTDSAFHEVWLQDELDPAAPEDLQADYGALLDEMSTSGFVQRHYVVIRWDVDGRLTTLAGRRAPGLPGYLSLINSQIPIAHRRLVDAGYTRVRPLSGPVLAAVLRHLQHPGWPIDRASDVTLHTCWLPSHDEWSTTEVVSSAPDPLDPDLLLPKSSWLHRTAQVPVQALESRELDGLWLAPLLTGLDEPLVRTLSTHIQFVPAREAKVGARRDATSDRAEIIAQQRKGQLIDDETELALSAANRRYGDLREGAGHHGAVWSAYLTISARGTEELSECVTHIEEAADHAGIARLDWLDTRQSAAAATTWPPSRITTRSQTSSTSESRCELSSTETPRWRTSSSSTRTVRRPTGSSAEVGSSSRRSRGSPTSAWAMPSRCCIPFGIPWTRRWAASDSATSSRSRKKAAAPPVEPESRWCSSSTSSAVYHPGKRNSSARYPSAARAAREPAGCPPTTAVPDVGLTSPAAILTSVDFPAPFGPSRPTSSPSSTSTSTPRRASTGP